MPESSGRNKPHGTREILAVDRAKKKMCKSFEEGMSPPWGRQISSSHARKRGELLPLLKKKKSFSEHYARVSFFRKERRRRGSDVQEINAPPSTVFEMNPGIFD